MKKTTDEVMDELDIDRAMRPLIGEMWRRGYKTKASCEGHGRKRSYVLFEDGGNGWFERNAHKYGLSRVLNGPCCSSSVRGVACGHCGAGIRGNVIYRGRIQNPFIDENIVVLSC